MYIYLQRIFSFCETAESKNKIHAFDTTVVSGCGMYEKLVNLYKIKSSGCPKNLLESGAYKTPFLVHLLDMQGVGTHLLTFCF